MKTSHVIAKIVCVASVALISASCAGVKCSIKATNIDQPVSFTPCVYGATGNVIRVAEQDKIKHFKIKRRFWAMFWRSLNITQNEWDLSADLTREISAAKGNAIVNMTVLSESDWWWYFSSLLPIIPNQQTILIEGDVALINQDVMAQ